MASWPGKGWRGRTRVNGTTRRHPQALWAIRPGEIRPACLCKPLQQTSPQVSVGTMARRLQRVMDEIGFKNQPRYNRGSIDAPVTPRPSVQYPGEFSTRRVKEGVRLRSGPYCCGQTARLGNRAGKISHSSAGPACPISIGKTRTLLEESILDACRAAETGCLAIVVRGAATSSGGPSSYLLAG